MKAILRGFFALIIFTLVAVVPIVYFRYAYTFSKRLREVVPGVLYRSGQLTAPGFIDAIKRLGIRTVINAQDEFPNPQVAAGFFTWETVPEEELCRQLGVRYVHLPPRLLSPNEVESRRPEAIDQFLAIMDDPANYPVLLHCRAGLHRTGVLSAVFRMEYQGWPHKEALDELRALGFGELACTSANEYVTQYVLSYRPGERRPY
ncbi:MAG: tyrosine-protein phosphatase [Gemmataceae bacterium]|nr:tyrosine-protein phosphatase [Gemmataceae bacterium]MDW8267291.1 tyrosine-protein phosphatase [Gemmataceae bacterium]